MSSPYDFIGLIAWILIAAPTLMVLQRSRFDLDRSDIVFIAFVLLVLVQLLWLRVGYSV